MTERSLQTKILKKLKRRGGVWVNKSPSRWDPEGIVDLLGCYYGIYVAIELKQPGKYADPWEGCTEPQKRFLQRVSAAGGLAFAADAWGTVDKHLAEIDAGRYPSTGSAAA